MYKLTRKCPKCNKELHYSSRRNFNRALKNGGVCFDCNLCGHTFNEGRIASESTREKMSICKKGKKRTDELKEKLRYHALERIKKLGITRGYNPKACQFIDEYGKKNGYNFQHAMNGGEVIISGYCIDGYDKEKNVVFEYDEINHTYPSVKIKDGIRQKRLIDKIKPSSFLRYDEKSNKLYDVISSKTILI